MATRSMTWRIVDPIADKALTLGVSFSRPWQGVLVRDDPDVVRVSGITSDASSFPAVVSLFGE